MFKRGDKIVLLSRTSRSYGALPGATGTVVGFQDIYILIKWDTHNPKKCNQMDGTYPPQDFNLESTNRQLLFSFMDD